MSRLRQLKPLLREILGGSDFAARLPELNAWPPRQVTGPLFSLLLDPDELIRWRAVTGFGHVLAQLAGHAVEKAAGPSGGQAQGMEQARVLMRLCMWRLNEESGNLGWGTPECMGEAMARHEGLALEYHRILASYIIDDPDREGNFLDHALLRRGVYWGLGRLAQVRPHLVFPAEPALLAALAEEEDRANRGLAAWTLGILAAPAALVPLRGLEASLDPVDLYHDGGIERTTVGQLASEAIACILNAEKAAPTAPRPGLQA